MGWRKKITNQESPVTVTISHTMTTVSYIDLQVSTYRDPKGPKGNRRDPMGKVIHMFSTLADSSHFCKVSVLYVNDQAGRWQCWAL